MLEVLSRCATSTSGGGTAAMPIGATTFFIPVGTMGIATLLRVGIYDKPIVFQNCQSWRYCARLVAKDIDAWLSANASLLEEPVTGDGTRLPPDHCEEVARALAAAPGDTLTAKIRALNPNSYNAMTDDKLESLYRAQFPCLFNPN